MSSFTHWFYVNKCVDGFRIDTFGLGNHPSGHYWYDDKDQLNDAIKNFESDGYKNLTRQLTN